MFQPLYRIYLWPPGGIFLVLEGQVRILGGMGASEPKEGNGEAMRNHAHKGKESLTGDIRYSGEKYLLQQEY
jgi:hypothetical protein